MHGLTELLRDIFGEVFSPKTGISHIAWGLLIPAIIRGWNWIQGKSFTKKKEILFWCCAPIAVWILLASARDVVKEASPKGGLVGGVLGVTQIPDEQTRNVTNAFSSTNIEAFTMSGIAGPGAAMEKGIDLIFVLRVANSGQPSIAWPWKASVTMPNGGSPIRAIIPSISGIVGGMPTVTGPFQLRIDNNIIQQLSENSLATGSSKVGWLPVHLNGLRKIDDGTEIRISFQDAFGKETTVPYIWRAGI